MIIEDFVMLGTTVPEPNSAFTRLRAATSLGAGRSTAFGWSETREIVVMSHSRCLGIVHQVLISGSTTGSNW